MGEKIPHTDNLRDALRRGADHLKAAIDCGVTVACLLLEDHHTDKRAGAVEIEKTPALSDDVELVTTKELARRTSYSTRQIQTFKLEGMPHIGEGRRTRFKLQEALAWLEQHSRKHQANNRVSMAGNGRIANAPIKTRLQASHRR